MQIQDRKIGPEHPPLGHCRDRHQPWRRPECGAPHGDPCGPKAGAEIVKHQTHFVWDEMTDEAKSVLPPNAGGKSIWEVMEDCALPCRR